MSESLEAGRSLPATGEPRPGGHRRAVVATAVGSLLEWYDFAVYAALASALGALFFPSASAAASLLASLSVFAVGYVARPIGAVLFGRLADSRGRKASLVLLIVVMGLATVGIAFLPTYASIGVVAPILLVTARAIQGLAIGGEFATATTYLVELAPPGRRGVYGSFVYATAAAGFALGLGVVVALNAVVTPQGVVDGWWRLAFLFSLPLLLIGRILRRQASETAAFQQARNHAATDHADPEPAVTRFPLLAIGQVVGVSVGVAVGAAVLLGFAVAYLIAVVKQPPSVAYPSVLLACAVGVGIVLISGRLADRVGRKPLMIGSAFAVAAIAYPAFALMAAGGFWTALAGQLLLWIPVGIALGVLPSLLAEMFPARSRTTSFGVPFAIVTAAFSGTAPLVSTSLIELTGSVLAPAGYLVVVGVLSGLVALGLRETAWGDLEN